MPGPATPLEAELEQFERITKEHDVVAGLTAVLEAVFGLSERDLEFAWATFLTRGMEQGAIRGPKSSRPRTSKQRAGRQTA